MNRLESIIPLCIEEIHWIQKEPLTSEEEVLKRRFRFQKLRREMYSTLHLSQALRKAAYSDMKKTTNRRTFAFCFVKKWDAADHSGPGTRSRL